MINVKYAFVNTKLIYENNEIDLNAYLSLYGLVQALEYESAHKKFGQLLDVPIKIKIDSFKADGVVVREENERGSFYNFRFLQLSALERRQIRYLIDKYHLNPSWKRELPRLHAVSRNINALLPELAMISFENSLERFQVLNFSANGLLLESIRNLDGLRIGQGYEAELLLSDGSEITSMQVRLSRICEEFDAETHYCVQQFAFHIESMSETNKERYQTMIRSYYALLKKLKAA